MIKKYSTIKRSRLASTAGMLDVIKVMNEMVEDKIIKDSVIGGGAATSLQGTPYTTEDIDFFCLYFQDSKFILLEPLFSYLKKRGGYFKDYKGKQTFFLGMWAIDFTPITTPLVEEAMKNSTRVSSDGVNFKMFSPEYLVAIAIETNRPKDRNKIPPLIELPKFNLTKLEKILTKFSLLQRWCVYQETVKKLNEA